MGDVISELERKKERESACVKMVKMVIPPGYHFVPTDEELITSFLLKASIGLPMPPVCELCQRDLYGDKDPWDVLRDVTWDNDHHMESNKSKHIRITYVLTTLSRSDSKSRAARRTRTGTWKGQTSGTKICNESGQLIGIKKMFSFMPDDKEKEKGSNGESWIMHEYSLAGMSLNYDQKNKDLVLCRIKHVFKPDNLNNHHHYPILYQESGNNNNNKRSRSAEQDEEEQGHAQKMQMQITDDPDDDTMSFWREIADLTSCSTSDLDDLGVTLQAPQEEITHHQFQFPKRFGIDVL